MTLPPHPGTSPLSVFSLMLAIISAVGVVATALALPLVTERFAVIHADLMEGRPLPVWIGMLLSMHPLTVWGTAMVFLGMIGTAEAMAAKGMAIATHLTLLFFLVFLWIASAVAFFMPLMSLIESMQDG